MTWNYSEAGHGKGAPDGVGGTLKKICDRIVSQNNDVANFEQFFKTVTENVKKIQVLTIDSAKDDNLQKEAKDYSMPMKRKNL